MNSETFEEKAEYKLKYVLDLRDSFKTHRSKKERMWKLIDAYDSGNFWDTMRKKLPKHYIIPETNHVFYVGNNIVGSTYSAPYIADVLPINPEDQDDARKLNKFTEHLYNEKNMALKQLQMGQRASRINVGFLQIGWNSSKKFKVGDTTYTGDIDYTVRDAMAVLIDPNYANYQEGRAVFITTEDSVENVLAEYPDYREDIEKLGNKNKNSDNEVEIIRTESLDNVGKGYLDMGTTPNQEGMLSVTVAYVKKAKEKGGLRVDFMVVINDKIVVEYIKGMKPNYFPIVPLYDQPPIKNGYGISTVQRILRNSMTINILDAIASTHIYSSQRTPMILDMRSGINPLLLRKDMNNPDRIFTSRGEVDIDKIIQRLDFSELPGFLPKMRDQLEESIKMVSGIDDKYTGRDTGSVTTTGGMERLQSRSSMTDNIRIAMIEKYAKDWTKMSLDFFILHAGGERSFMSNANYEEQVEEIMTIDFSKYKDYAGELEDGIPMTINATPLLPKNRARLQESANTIMQVQLQYQGQMDLLSPEEWLRYQDMPQKDLILDRMQMDRYRNDREDVQAEITNFMGMTDRGFLPEHAMDQLAKERAVKREPSVMRKQVQTIKNK